MPRFDPALETLLSCARTNAGAAEAEAILRAADDGVDYQRLVSLAREHGVIPLLHRSLKSTCWELVPPEIRDALDERASIIERKSLLWTAELVRLLGVFERAGIVAVPFKGPVLAASAYGDVALREYADLDLVVCRDDLERVQELLQNDGYYPRENATRRARSIFLRNECEQGFRRPADSALVEVHWQLAQRYFGFPLDIETRWGSLIKTDFLGCQVWTFPPEDLLLYLCVHGARHLWSQLKWVCDVAEFIRANPTIDWERAVAGAAGLKNERTLLLGIALARDLLGAAVPAAIQARLERCTWIKPLVNGIAERWQTSREPRSYETVRFHLGLKTGPVNKLAQAVRLACISTANDWGPDGPSLLSMVRRPFRLVWKYR